MTREHLIDLLAITGGLLITAGVYLAFGLPAALIAAGVYIARLAEQAAKVTEDDAPTD